MEFQKYHEDSVAKKMNYLLAHPTVISMKNNVQHGNTSTYDHCFNVAVLSYILSKKLHIKVNTKEMLVGAILHDFYLYDWHSGRKRKDGWHCFTHPETALRNAERYFSLTKKEKNIIRCHMFPATLFHVPMCKEAVIVCISDKICATMETFECGFLDGIRNFVFPKKYCSQERG